MMLDLLDDIVIESSDLEWLSHYLFETAAASPSSPEPPSSPLSPLPSLSTPASKLCVPLGHPSEFELGRADEANSIRKAEWTHNEDLIILATFREVGTQWGKIANQLPGRTPDGVRNRWHRLQRRHGLGENMEGRRALDTLLSSCGIDKNGTPAPERFASPQVDEVVASKAADGRSKWSAEEDAIIYEGVRQHGFRWRQISSELPGRSDSSVRNRWRRLEKDNGRSSDWADESDETSSLDDTSIVPHPRSPKLFPLPPTHTHPSPPSLKRSRSSTIDVRDLLSKPNTASDRQTSDLLAYVQKTCEEGGEIRPKQPVLGEADAFSEPRTCRTTSLDSTFSSVSTEPYAPMAADSGVEDEDGAEVTTPDKKRCRPMWSTEEDMFIVRYVEKYGRVWSKMAEHMEGRSHRAVRNRWLRMEKGQATRASRGANGSDRCYRCRRCGEPKLGHICAAGLTSGTVATFNAVTLDAPRREL